MDNPTPSDVVSKLYASFGAGDMAGILSTLSEDIDWTVNAPTWLPFGGRFRGHDEIVRLFGSVMQTIAPERFEPRQFIEAGDRVVVLGFERTLAKETGRWFETDWVHVFTVRDGRIVHTTEFFDTAAIVEAFTPVASEAPAGTN